MKNELLFLSMLINVYIQYMPEKVRRQNQEVPRNVLFNITCRFRPVRYFHMLLAIRPAHRISFFFSNWAPVTLEVTLWVTCFVDLGEYLYFAKISITERQIFGGACLCVAWLLKIVMILKNILQGKLLTYHHWKN